MRLPMPREPECSITHTRSSSSRQTSMKWLPPPSEPRCVTLCASRMAGCLSSSSLQAVGQAAVGEQAADGVRHAVLPAALEADAAVRHGRLDAEPQLGEAVRQVAGGERRAHRHHAAADVDADRRRHDRRPGGDDGADGGALAQVHVRHHGDVAMDERQRGDVEQLAARRVLDRHALDPGLDRRVARLDRLRAGHG